MREFTMVSPQLWQSPQFMGLATDDARYLYLYLYAGPHQTSAGCYSIPDGYAQSDLGWSLEKYRSARESLIDAGLIRFDARTSEILITDWFRSNRPKNRSHRIGVQRLLLKIRSEELRAAALQAEEELQPTSGPESENANGAVHPLRATQYLRGSKDRP